VKGPSVYGFLTFLCLRDSRTSKSGGSILLVGYLGSHKQALKLWVHMARHYAPMKGAYLHNRTDHKGKDDNFERVWI
jgi:hypothetical protein